MMACCCFEGPLRLLGSLRRGQGANGDEGSTWPTPNRPATSGQSESSNSRATTPRPEVDLLPSDQRWLFQAAVQRFGLCLEEAELLKWLADPSNLAIYVEARPNLEQRLAILQPAIQWRRQNRELLRELRCPKCQGENALSHDARCFGADRDGDPVFMNCFALPRNLEPDGIASHMACLFELALAKYSKVDEKGSGPTTARVSGPAPSWTRWIWIVDLRGFGLRHCDPRTSIKLLHLLQVAYRGRLKKCIVLHAPSMFGVLWTQVQPLVKPKTREAIEFSDAGSDLRAQLQELIGTESVVSRIVAEIDENREVAQTAKRSKTWTPFWADGAHDLSVAEQGPSSGSHGYPVGSAVVWV